MSEPYIHQHTIYPDEFPESWASGWGEDEPERFNSETQHEVSLSKGFWIADTTVTQALWEAVRIETQYITRILF